MNNLVITKSILNEIYDDVTFKNAVSELLNSLIDSELLKEEPDFDFIDECVNVLIEVQSDDFGGVIPFITRNKTDSEGKSRKTLGIFLACAVVFSLSLGALAVNHTIETRKEKEKETTSTTEQTTVTTTVTTETTTAKKTTVKAHAVELWLSFSDSFKSVYATTNDLNFDGVTVNVDYSDGTSKTIDIGDCKITKALNDYIGKITVEYGGLSDSYFVTFSESDVPGFTVDPIFLFPFGEGVYDPQIEVSSSYVTVEVGRSISVPMRKSTSGFVDFTVDNDIFDDINISYHGSVASSRISLEITAGSTPGIATVSLARSGDPEKVLATVTVEVVESGGEPEAE